MAKIFVKANLFSAYEYSQRRNQKIGASFHSKRISGYCFKKNRCTSLKVKSLALRCDFNGQRVVYLEKKIMNKRRFYQVPIKAQMKSGLIGRTQKWWETGLQPNMKEVTSAQDLVDSLLNAGDELVVVDFFSPACGGCRALFPKICQLAKMNPDLQFLHVNYEEHKSICCTLNVHVLPFFRFYRGAEGRVCQFSCTNATIKKFKDALAKHTTDRCSVGPTKGLEEKELAALASIKDICFNYKPKPVQTDPNHVGKSLNPEDSEEKTLVGARE